MDQEINLIEERNNDFSIFNEKENIDIIILNIFSCGEKSILKEKKRLKNIKVNRGRRKKNYNLNIPGHLNTERDNQLKAIKVCFHKFIIKYLNKKLKKFNIKKKKFYRFVKTFQEAINIKINRKLLKTPVSEILMKIDAYKNLGNKNLLLYNELKNNKNLKKYFDMTYQELYEKFKKSDDVELLIKKKGNQIKRTIDSFISNYQSKDSKDILNDEVRDLYFKLFGQENDNP